MRILASCFLTLSFLLSGCATMFNGSNATVNIRSEEPNTKIYVNEAYVGTGSAVVSVPKKGQSSIRVTKEGCNDQTQAMGKKFDPTSLLGILLDFGIISMLVVDGAATGAINDIEPKSYILNPHCPQKVSAVSTEK